MPEFPSAHARGPKVAGFYGRVSVQDDDSIATQLAVVREFAARDGYEIPDDPAFVYADENISGTTKTRPNFDRLKMTILDRSAPFDRVYVRSPDRLGRWSDPRRHDYVAVLFEDHGVTIHCCDAEHIDFSDGVSPESVGQYISNKVDQVQSARERTSINRRMRRAKRYRVHEGFYPCGNAPYGFKRVLIDKRTRDIVREVQQGERVHIDGCAFDLIPLEGREREALQLIFDRIEEGHSMYTIALELRHCGYPVPDRSWWPSQIQRISRNPIYMGTLVWSRNGRKVDLQNPPPPTVEGDQPYVRPGFIKNPPICPEQFFRVQAILDARHAQWERRRACKPRYLLTGKVICARCGHNLCGTRESRTNRIIYAHPRIGHGNPVRTCPCECRSIRSSSFDQFVLDHVRTVLALPDLEARVRAYIVASLEGEAHQKVLARIESLRDDIKDRERRQRMLLDSLEQVDSDSSRASLLERINRLGCQIDGAEQQRLALVNEQTALASQLDLQARLVADSAALVEQLDHGSFDTQRRVIEYVIDFIRVDLPTRTAEIALHYI